MAEPSIADVLNKPLSELIPIDYPVEEKNKPIKNNLYQQVVNHVSKGDTAAAYNVFTELPFIEQMMIYMTPGVGDAISFVESGHFLDKSRKAKQEGRYGDMIGSGASALIAQASMLPLFGTAVDTLRVGSKGVEKGIGSLMNKVNTKMDNNIPGGGGGGKLSERDRLLFDLKRERNINTTDPIEIAASEKAQIKIINRLKEIDKK